MEENQFIEQTKSQSPTSISSSSSTNNKSNKFVKLPDINLTNKKFNNRQSQEFDDNQFYPDSYRFEQDVLM